MACLILQLPVKNFIKLDKDCAVPYQPLINLAAFSQNNSRSGKRLLGVFWGGYAA